jgi:large subunit ribosomal protein L4
MKLKCYRPDGKESEERDYGVPEIEGEKGVEALRQVLVAYGSNGRQGNASSKTRSEVRGTGKKPYRQKGTGSARHGSRRSNIWRGGGIVFGPKPRDYSQKINRKMKSVALGRAIFDRAVRGELDVIEEFDTAEPKTRLFNSLIECIAPSGSILVVDDSFSDNTILAVRNIARVAVSEADSVNAYDLSLYDRIVMSEKGMEKVLTRVKEEKSQ